MGCNSSKPAVATTTTKTSKQISSRNVVAGRLSSSSSAQQVFHGKIHPNKPERFFQLLQFCSEAQNRTEWYDKILEHLQTAPEAAQFIHPSTGATPLHIVCDRLMDLETSTCTTSSTTTTAALFEKLTKVIQGLVDANKHALKYRDQSDQIPLHYAMVPKYDGDDDDGAVNIKNCDWKKRAVILELLLQADRTTARHYLQRNDVGGGTTPLYAVLCALPDDFSRQAPTLDYVALVHSCFPHHAGTGNASNGDKPLSLLYRRFTRQFDISEQFFSGDNSRPEVVQHRQAYKTAAGNTWKCIELLLQPTNLPTPNTPWGIVHCAVQVETPPDLLRYIIETNAQDLTRVDPSGRLPLHYAAARKPPTRAASSSHCFPAFYTKYVMDELLYKFPEAAGMKDAQGNYPLTLAVHAGKQWIGGGIKSLYDAYPDALQQLNLDENPTLIRALSMNPDQDDDDDDDDDGNNHNHVEEVKQDSKTDDASAMTIEDRLKGVIKDQPHDAIMLVQSPTATIEEVTTSMWAHEEDAGVQMLGCVAITKMIAAAADSQPDIWRIALTATASVVNAMKAHPNEVIVQEKACMALQGLAVADGHLEVSMVASGAVAAVVGAMQAHVGDTGVQEHACRAISAICTRGAGPDRATVVASVSGVTAILNALAAHSSHVQVQVAGLEALQALTRHAKSANLPELPVSQTEPLLLAAQEAFPIQCGALVKDLLPMVVTTTATEDNDDNDQQQDPAKETQTNTTEETGQAYEV